MEKMIYHLATSLPGFLLAIVFHEWAHGYVALKFGDPTAKNQGRLSFNPAVHYDLMGTIIFPLIGIAMGGVIFGWAKPVPVDPRHFKNYKSGVFWVSFAGPIANVILAVVFSFGLAFMVTQIPGNFSLYGPFRDMLQKGILINLVLAVFNLIPFPPLDGAKMVSTFLDYNQARKYEELQRFTFLFFILLWTTPILSYIFRPVMLAGNGLINLFIRVLG